MWVMTAKPMNYGKHGILIIYADLKRRKYFYFSLLNFVKISEKIEQVEPI